MTSHLTGTGYRIIPEVLSSGEIEVYREEVDRLVLLKGSACVRNICRFSPDIFFLARKLGERFAEKRPCVRSLLFDKTSQRNWPVAWHQDLTIAVSNRRGIPGYGPWSIKEGVHCVQPPVEVLESMITVRIHLDDTPAENGALRVVPGSHLLGKIPPAELDRYTARSVTCECLAGDGLLMSPLIIHSSSRSDNPGHRRVLHFEYAEEGSLAGGLEWEVFLQG